MSNITLRSIDAVLILSNDIFSPRLLAKYYSAPQSVGGNNLNIPTTPTTGSKTNNAPASGPNGVYPGQANHPYVTLKDQLAFEKGLVQKTSQRPADITMYDNRIVVSKTISNITIYVVGPSSENELFLLSVVVCLKDVLSSLFSTSNDQQTLDKHTILENYDLVALAVDEIIDDGILLETDRDVILSRISPKPQPDMPNLAELELSEQSLISVWKFARRALKDSGF